VQRASGSLAWCPNGPAIANAIYDAIGVEDQGLPMTPERILAELKKKTQGMRIGANEKVSCLLSAVQ